jgi:hypothetical protein
LVNINSLKQGNQENIDIDEYTDTELALLVQNELALADELEQNNIVIGENKENIPVIELIGDNYVN